MSFSVASTLGMIHIRYLLPTRLNCYDHTNLFAYDYL